MRVLFVTPYYHPELQFGGPPKRLHQLATKLLDRGHVMSVVTLDSRDRGRRDRATYDGINVTYVSWRTIAGRPVPVELHNLKDEVEAAHVVHCYGLYNFIGPAAIRLARRRRVPYLLEPMGMYVPIQRNLLAKRVYNATITRRIARDAAAIVATSVNEAEQLAPLAAFSKLIVRRNGIELAEYANLGGGLAFRNRWQIGASEKAVGFVGRISSKKNIHGLISAFEQADISDASLMIIGPASEPDYAEQIRHQIAASPQRAKIRFCGPLYNEDLKAAWDALDLFVLPSFDENFGNAAGEAVAAGVPVLLTETCGIAPLIHGRAGLAVPVSVPGLTTGLRTMMDPAKREALMAGREEVKREISWEEPVAQTEQLYRQIVGGEATGASPPDRAENTS